MDQGSRIDGPHETQVSSLRERLYRGDVAAAHSMVESGVSLNAFDAAALGDVERLVEWLDLSPSVLAEWSADGFTLLHLAAFLGGAEITALLVERGADVAAVARNPMGVQPLHSAAARGDVDTCRVLLEAGADPDAVQQGGWRPLDATVRADHHELRALLEMHGATASGNLDA